MEKTGITLRLTKTTRDQLNQAAHILRRTKSNIAEEALLEFFKEHRINGVYQLTLTSSKEVLLRLDDPPKVLEVADRNGVAPETVVKQYAERLQAPVRLVMED